MAHSIQRTSPCQWMSDSITKFVPAVVVSIFPRTTAVVGTLFASCALLRSGISDLAHRNFLKGTVKTLAGGAGVAVSSFCIQNEIANPMLLPPPDASSSNLLPLDQRVENRLAEVHEEDLQLRNRVSSALQTGGQLLYNASASGVYLILTNLGQIIATFKPNLERNWGPNNRDPDRRSSDPSPDDIYFQQLSAFHQGQPSERQYLARLLDFAKQARLPVGYISEMQSDQFVDLAAESLGQPATMQTQVGYVQEWIDDAHTVATVHPKFQRFLDGRFPEAIDSIPENPLFNQLPLDDFQEAAVSNVLLYNQDGHARNYLFQLDAEGVPHLRPIDMDVILPFKLNDLVGIVQHSRANEPFTENTLQLIQRLDPDFVQALALRMDLPAQCLTNIKALAIVLRSFSEADLTLADIHRFISHPQRDMDSPLWELMMKAKDAAVNALSSDDLPRYQYAQFLRWSNWRNQATPGEIELLHNYNMNDAFRINEAIEQNFWRFFNQNLNQIIANWRT